MSLGWAKKLRLKHLHVWGCIAKATPYRHNEKKLDSTMVSCYFIGYSKRSRGYKFYNPMNKSILELGNALFFEDVEFAGEDTVKNFVFKEAYLIFSQVLLALIRILFPALQEIISNEQTPPLKNLCHLGD